MKKQRKIIKKADIISPFPFFSLHVKRCEHREETRYDLNDGSANSLLLVREVTSDEEKNYHIYDFIPGKGLVLNNEKKNDNTENNAIADFLSLDMDDINSVVHFIEQYGFFVRLPGKIFQRIDYLPLASRLKHLQYVGKAIAEINAFRTNYHSLFVYVYNLLFDTSVLDNMDENILPVCIHPFTKLLKMFWDRAKIEEFTIDTGNDEIVLPCEDDVVNKDKHQRTLKKRNIRIRKINKKQTSKGKNSLLKTLYRMPKWLKKPSEISKESDNKNRDKTQELRKIKRKKIKKTLIIRGKNTPLKALYRMPKWLKKPSEIFKENDKANKDKSQKPLKKNDADVRTNNKNCLSEQCNRKYDYVEGTSVYSALFLMRSADSELPKHVRLTIDYFYESYRNLIGDDDWLFVDKADLYYAMDEKRKDDLCTIAKYIIKEEIDEMVKNIHPSYNIDTMSQGWEVNDLWTALYMSLFFMTSSSAIYRLCANEKCGQYFLVNSTNSRKKYCSDKCRNYAGQCRHQRKKKEMEIASQPDGSRSTNSEKEEKNQE